MGDIDPRALGFDIYANDEPGDPNPGVMIDGPEWQGKALTPNEARALAQAIIDVADHMERQAPGVTTWADGWGVWHARVPRDCVSPLIAARRALRDELVPREPRCDRAVWMHPERIPELDTDDTIVYREGDPS